MKEILQTKFSTDYLKNIEILLARCSPRKQVEFALYCASDLEQYYDVEKFPEIYKARRKCLELVKAWLVDPSSVTTEQLRIAAKVASDAATTAYSATYSAAYAASYATHAAIYAAAYAASYATNAATAAAAYAASYATNAAVRATNAADAATYAAVERSVKLKQFYAWLFDKLTEGMNKNTLEVLYGNF